MYSVLKYSGTRYSSTHSPTHLLTYSPTHLLTEVKDMLELHLPWLELAIVTPLVGALLVFRVRDPELAWRRSLVATGMSLCFALGAWQDFGTLDTFEAHDRGDFISPLLGGEALVIDRLSAPLLPLVTLLYFSITLATLRTKFRRISFAWMLISLSLLLALLSCRQTLGRDRAAGGDWQCRRGLNCVPAAAPRACFCCTCCCPSDC